MRTDETSHYELAAQSKVVHKGEAARLPSSASLCLAKPRHPNDEPG